MPGDYSIFPAINATLNGSSAVLLVSARTMIKRGRLAVHRALMLAAVTTSSLFLISYLYYHWHVGNVRFQGHGWSRPVYFSILISHTILAAAIVPLVIITLSRGLRQRYDRHRVIARWTYPLWLYVSITGVVIYLMLFQLFRAA
jgi:putative membrane protein